MATTETLVSRQVSRTEIRRKHLSGSGVLVTGALTVFAVLIHGYHPFAEDGGVYLPGILKLLHPELYPSWTNFVTAQMRFSLFAPFVAGLARFSGIGVMFWVLALYVGSIWITLYAGWLLVRRCTDSVPGRCAGVSALALCLTMPIAGTSLMLMDPYVTARSISTPCVLLSILGVVDLVSDLKFLGIVRWQSAALCLAGISVAAAMHPLMAGYGAGCVLLVVCASIDSARIRLLAFAMVALLSVAVASLLYFLAPEPPTGYALVGLTRDYWFLSTWHWYEIVGLIAPLMILSVFLLKRGEANEPASWLARAAVAAGVVGLFVAVTFSRQAAHSYIVAMLQPLRIFQMVYIVMLLLMGASLGRYALKQRPWRWMALFAILGSLMLVVQYETYPHSAHLEFPWAVPQNGWEQGFVWIRDNTPKQAAFAMDANYIFHSGEDAQNFKAIAERSAPPDYAKDGGVAAISPALTSDWIKFESLQVGLDNASDSVRRTKLSAAGIQWIVLPAVSMTGFPCPYRNNAMKVCRIP